MKKLFSQEFGLDLGTTNIRLYLKGVGLVANEPSVIAFNMRSQEVVCLGEQALRMLGKTPQHIKVVRPVEHGIISDFEVAEQMLRLIFERVYQRINLSRPKIIAAIPLDITEVERKSLEDICAQLGSKKTFLVERPMAAAIGNKLPVSEPIGNLVGEMGGGLSEIAVVSLNGIVAFKSLKIGGETLTQRLIDYVKENFALELGYQTAEEAKNKLITAWPLKPQTMKVKGKELSTSLPREIDLTDEDVRKATVDLLGNIVEAIKDTIDATPTELVADIYKRGISLSGGLALIPGFDKLISQQIDIPVHIVDDPLTTVIRGIGLILHDFKNLKEVLIPSSKS